jgi:ATP-binding cassette, subfamily B, bacterial
VRPPWHVRAARHLRVVFFYGFSAGPAAMALGIVLAVVSAVVSVSYTLGFKVVIDAIVAGHAAGVLLGTLVVGVLFSASWILAGVSALVAFYVGNLCTGYLSSRVARLTATIPGLEHHERPDFLKQLDLLRRNLYTLSNAPSQSLLALQVLVRMVTVVVLLATVDPVLAFMPLLGAFPVVGDDLAARRRERADQAVVERGRLANALFDLASTPAQPAPSWGSHSSQRLPLPAAAAVTSTANEASGSASPAAARSGCLLRQRHDLASRSQPSHRRSCVHDVSG